MLSKRADRLMYDKEKVIKYSPHKACRDLYDPTTNPNGIVNLGIAVNELMDDVLLQRFKENNNFLKVSKNHFRYYNFWGSDAFLKKLAGFMTRFFKPTEPLCYENLLVLNGALLSLDILTALTADEGDVILLPVPCYNGFNRAGAERWNVKMCPIPMTLNKGGEEFTLSIKAIEEAYDQQIALNKNVRGFLLNNPHNPLGVVIPKELVLDIMNFCQRKLLHLIVDEVFCMSVFDKTEDFHSVLRLKTHKDNTLEANRIHVCWGFSKDLCLTSFCAGVIHTENEMMKMALQSMSWFQSVPLPVLTILENLITDIDWFESVFVPENHRRLEQAYNKAKDFFRNYGIPTTRSTVGFFFLADFRGFLNVVNEGSVNLLVEKFYRHKIYLLPIPEMRTLQPGWFRVVFTVSDPVMNEGFARLQNALEDSC